FGTGPSGFKRSVSMTTARELSFAVLGWGLLSVSSLGAVAGPARGASALENGTPGDKTEVCPITKWSVECDGQIIVAAGGSECVDGKCVFTPPPCPQTSAAMGGGCTRDDDCPMPLYCRICEDGTCVGPTPQCVEGQCLVTPP